MKAKIVKIFWLLLMTNSLAFSQEEPRYELTLNTEYSGIKSKIKIANISYSLSNYIYGTADITAETKPEPCYISLTIADIISKDFFKFFETQKRKINGSIDIKDNFGKNPPRKIEFKNASLIFSENIANFASGNTASLIIYGETLIIDGTSIFSK